MQPGYATWDMYIVTDHRSSQPVFVTSSRRTQRCTSDGWESTGGAGNGEIYFEGTTLRNGYSAWRARTVHHEAVLFSCVPVPATPTYRHLKQSRSVARTCHPHRKLGVICGCMLPAKRADSSLTTSNYTSMWFGQSRWLFWRSRQLAFRVRWACPLKSWNGVDHGDTPGVK